MAHLAKSFEYDWVHSQTGKKGARCLKRDQVLFLSQFASTCNAVWEDEQRVLKGDSPVQKRRCFNFLLIGQGGSGKTALVQDVVLPAMGFLFSVCATLIVCGKWSQAENISTETHKAVTMHRAGCVGV